MIETHTCAVCRETGPGAFAAGKNTCARCQSAGWPRWNPPDEETPAEAASTVTTGRAGEPGRAVEHQGKPSPATVTTEPETATAEPSAPRSVITDGWRTRGSAMSTAERQRRWRRRHPTQAARNLAALTARSREKAKQARGGDSA